jgi:hypothetical protein
MIVTASSEGFQQQRMVSALVGLLKHDSTTARNHIANSEWQDIVIREAKIGPEPKKENEVNSESVSGVVTRICGLRNFHRDGENWHFVCLSKKRYSSMNLSPMCFKQRTPVLYM